MSNVDFVLAIALFCAVVLNFMLWIALREERQERKFWYESSGRAWESLFARVGLEEEDID